MLTVLRIILSAVLLVLKPLSMVFLIVYVLCGVTDIADGIVARLTGTVSKFGSGLDSMADFVFVAVCLIRLLPVLQIASWTWIWIGLIAALKVADIVLGFIRRKKLTFLHTNANKLTGLVLFVIPLTLTVIDMRVSAMLACILATYAAVQEGYFILSKPEI